MPYLDEALNRIHPGWKDFFQQETTQPYFQAIDAFLTKEAAAGKEIYPPRPLIFNAYHFVAPADVKVVILGQDPYHGPGQAHGLCFSVPDGVPPPPSLVNIFKELHHDLRIPPAASGNLTPWARQGVFLLNAILTVERSRPRSHEKIGWLDFTDRTIRHLSDRFLGIVFLLWGKNAQDKARLIDANRHFILTAAHPSPYSARGFFGCRHFSKTNEILRALGKKPIDWVLT